MTEAELVRIRELAVSIFRMADDELKRLRLERKVEQATAHRHLWVVSS